MKQKDHFAWIVISLGLEVFFCLGRELSPAHGTLTTGLNVFKEAFGAIQAINTLSTVYTVLVLMHHLALVSIDYQGHFNWNCVLLSCFVANAAIHTCF